jgi:hypothetical protein
MDDIMRHVANLLVAVSILSTGMYCASANQAATDPDTGSAADVKPTKFASEPRKADGASVTLSAPVSGHPTSAPDSNTAVRLSVHGVAVHGGDDVIGFKVFLNKKDATRDTPLSDPHYVGSFALGELSKVHVENVNLDATRAFNFLHTNDRKSAARFTATLVPIFESQSTANSKTKVLASKAELQILPINKDSK